MEARATLALKPGVWFRRGRLLIVSPDSLGTACPLSGRNSTYRLVQILEAGSLSGFRKLDYLVSHYIIGNVAAIKKPKRYQCDFICKTHDPDRLWVESVAI
jgi:hypothetical protein